MHPDEVIFDALIARRDTILQSLRCQFRAKVLLVTLKTGDFRARIDDDGHASAEQVDALLLDLANNLAQALADDADDFGSSVEACRAADGVEL